MSDYGRTMKRLVAAGVILAGAAAAPSFAAPGDPGWEQKPYIVKDGKVSYDVYNGYRRFNSTCHTCHGADGAGGSFAPSLVDSLKTLSYEQFAETLVNGKQGNMGSGQAVMPSFGENNDVMTNMDDIYSYLKARSNGDVGRSRPQRLPADQDPVWKERKEGA